MAQFVVLQKSLYIIRIDHRRFQRTQTDPKIPRDIAERRNDLLHAVRFLRQLARLIRPDLLHLIKSRIDPRQHDLPIPASDQLFCFRHDFRKPPAAHFASRIRDNAVGAKTITSFLYLDIRPRPVFRVDHQARLVVSVQLFVALYVKLAHAMFLKLGDVVRQMALFIGARHDIHAVHRRHFLRADLSVAARHHHHTVRIYLFHPANILPGLFIRYSRDRAGIDHVNIGKLPLVHHSVSLLFERRRDCLRFILIYFASKRMECDLHKFPPRI